MVVLAGVLLILTILYLGYSLINKKELKKKNLMMIFSVVIFSILLLSFCLKPPESFDLYRYFLEIDYFRKAKPSESWAIIFSKTNIIFCLIEYIVALVSNHNSFIFMLTTPVTIGIFAYILIKTNQKYHLSTKQIILCFITFFSIINTIHLMSGIRNALAVAVYSLGAYLLMFNKNKWGYLFYLLSIFIHPMTIIIFIVQIVSKYLCKIKNGALFFLFWSLLVGLFSIMMNAIANIIPLNLFVFIANKIQVELSTNLFYDYRILVFEIAQIILITYIVSCLIKIKDDQNQNLFPFYFLGFFIIGSLMLPNIFTRTRFIYAFFLPYILGYSQFKKKNNEKIENILLGVSTIVCSFYIYYMYCNGVFI